MTKQNSKAEKKDPCCAPNAEKGDSRCKPKVEDSSSCSSTSKSEKKDSYSVPKTSCGSKVEMENSCGAPKAPKKDSCCTSKADDRDSNCSKKVKKNASCSSSSKPEKTDSCCVPKAPKKDSGCTSKADDRDSNCSKKVKNASCSSSSKLEKTDSCCAPKTEKEDSCSDQQAPKKGSCCASKVEDCAPKKEKEDLCCTPQAQNIDSSCTPKAEKKDSCCAPEKKATCHASKVKFPCKLKTPHTCVNCSCYSSCKPVTLEKEECNCKIFRRPCTHKKENSNDKNETMVSVNIAGMTCAGCSSRIENFLLEQKGVTGVSISLLTHHADINYDASVLEGNILELIDSLGFKASERVQMNSSSGLFVEVVVGHDPEVLKNIELTLSQREGVEELSIQRLSGKKANRVLIMIVNNPENSSVRSLYEWLQQELGSDAISLVPLDQMRLAAHDDIQKQHKKLEIRFLLSILFAIPIVVIIFILPAIGYDNFKYVEVCHGLSVADLLCFLFTTPVQVYIAQPIYESAFSAIYFSKRANMDVLIALSTTAAYIFSLCTILINIIKRIPLKQELPQTYFEVSALLICFIFLGRVVEQRSKIRTSESIQNLMGLQVKTAVLLEKHVDANGKTLVQEETIPMELVQRGDHLKIFPGARIPIDGVIVEGKGEVDESMVTGESMLVPKAIGSEVIGGTINQTSAMEMLVSKGVHETLLSQIVELVENAQTSKADVQRVADVIASYFTLGIISLATIMFLVWFFLAYYGVVKMDSPSSTPLGFALRFAITILVISCPCAISLAVPTVVMVATGVGARIGLLVRGGQILESLHKANVYVFDKTGTLTSGKPKVVDTLLLGNDVDQSRFWTLVASAESNSEHPLGQALVEYGDQMNCPILSVSDFKNEVGCGITCVVDGEKVYIGTLRWLNRENIDTNGSFSRFVDIKQADGCTVVYVAIATTLRGIVCLRDSPRPEAKFVVQELQRKGHEVWMITGDQLGTANSVARELGIDEFSVIAEATPEVKINKITMAQTNGNIITFVGDGINDAPALAAADVGIAVGAGTDVALSTADIILVKDDLRDILNAKDLADTTVSRIKWNFVWGFVYNVIMMPIASGALYVAVGFAIPPAFAGLSELLSSVPVILMSLLLNFFKPRYNKQTTKSTYTTTTYGTNRSNELVDLADDDDYDYDETTSLLKTKRENIV